MTEPTYREQSEGDDDWTFVIEHRRDCDQPTPTETPSRVLGLVIRRCPTCDAVELRRT